MTEELHATRRWTDTFARLVLRHPWPIIVVSIVLGAAGGLLGWFHLPLDANTDSLISRDRPWMKGYLAFLKEFGDLEYLYVVVDTKDPKNRGEGERAVDDMLERLHAMRELPAVHGRIDPDEQWRLTTRAAPTEFLRGLSDASGALPALAAAGDWLGSADEALKRLTTGPIDAPNDAEQRQLGAATILLLDAVASAGDDVRGKKPELALAQLRAPEYLASPSGKLLFISILPRKDFGTLAAIEEPLAKIRAAIAESQKLFPNVEIGLTGKPVLQADELITSAGDTRMSFGVGLAIVAALCVIIYRNWRRPLLAVIAFAVAVGCTEGAAAILVGRLTLLSMVFLLVLIGAGLDYGIHVISRYTEFRATLGVADSMRRTLHTVAAGTLSGAVTSAAVFVLAIFSNFGGLRELGIIAGAGLMICATVMLTTLPALLLVLDSHITPKPAHDIRIPGVNVGVKPLFARISLGVFALLSLVSLLALAFLMRFESNLLKLQSENLDSVRWERRVLDDSASLSWFGAVPCDTQAEALAIIERARLEPEIGWVRSVFDIVQPTTPERDELSNRIAASTQGSFDKGAELPPVNWTAQRLTSVAQQVKLLATFAGRRASPEDIAHLRSLATRLEAFAGAYQQGNNEELARRRDEVRRRVRNAAAQILDGAHDDLRESLPAAVRDKFVSPQGKLLVELIPKNNTWELDKLRSFVAAMRRVDPNATGVPITQSESITDMTNAFVTICIWSLVAVAGIAWFDFRSLKSTGLCIGVLIVGILITLGCLAVAGIPLSLANFFGIPMLIGLGIDSNIHLLHRAHETHHKGSRIVEFGSTRSAVIFTALTTAIGFGGQIFADHRGMQGLGWIMVIGSLVCISTSVWLLPALLRLGVTDMTDENGRAGFTTEGAENTEVAERKA